MFPLKVDLKQSYLVCVSKLELSVTGHLPLLVTC